MFKRTFQFLLIAGLVTGVMWAADNHFLGDWKLNPSRSKLTDVMKVESLGAHKYGFDFGGGSSEAIAVDGTDQPGIFGTTLAVSEEGPNSWKVVRKKAGHMLLTANWKLSQDGNTLTDDYTEFPPNGSPLTVNYVYKRTAVGPGFAGTWESTIAMVNSPFVLQIRPYEGNGLSLHSSEEAEEDDRKMKFDGKDYPKMSRSHAQDSTSSARRVDERTLEITDKLKGKITRTEQIELSPDFKILTRTVHPAGQREPNIFVFERQ